MNDEFLHVCVFPLPSVNLFPDTCLPLHIFEPRYKDMLQDSMIQNWPIALCSHQQINEYGATCGADYQCVVKHLVKNKTVSGIGRPQLIQNNENSTFDILLKGTGLVELQDVIEMEPYALVRAKKLVVQNDIQPEQRFQLNRIRLALKTCLEERSTVFPALRD